MPIYGEYEFLPKICEGLYYNCCYLPIQETTFQNYNLHARKSLTNAQRCYSLFLVKNNSNSGWYIYHHVAIDVTLDFLLSQETMLIIMDQLRNDYLGLVK